VPRFFSEFDAHTYVHMYICTYVENGNSASEASFYNTSLPLEGHVLTLLFVLCRDGSGLKTSCSGQALTGDL
jgi:hypothetical protein